MPSVLEQRFKVTITIDRKHERVVQKYLEDNIGIRTYYLHSRFGGKRWAIDRTGNSTIKVNLDDESLASYLSLKFL